jgi:hypothetical protein
MENVHIKTLVVSALVSALIGGLITYLGLTFGMARQIAINTERLDRLEASYVTKAQFDQFQAAEMDKWEKWIQEARDTRTDLREFSVQLDKFSIEHAKIFFLLQQHVHGEKKPMSDETITAPSHW